MAVGVSAAVEAGAFADVALRDELAAAALEPAHIGRATALAFGAVRLRGRCDFVLRPLLRQPLAGLEPVLRAVLRVGCYELLWAERTVAPAAVHELVEIAKQRGHPRLAGITNGVLRNLVRQAHLLRDCPVALRRAEQLEEYLTEWESHPAWLIRRWLETYGPETTKRLVEVGNREPRPHLRVNRLKTDREALRTKLREAGLAAEDTPLSEFGVKLDHPGAVPALPGFADGWFTVQDQGAMVIAPVTDAVAGERVIDLCAAPGGKATHLAEQMGDQGEVLAFDLWPERVEQIVAGAARLGLRCLTARAADARELVGEVVPADVVLLDTPCTGSGTLARRPDLRWQIGPRRLQELVPLQRELLTAAAALTRVGGRLVYATCSLEPEENEAQMAWFDATLAGFAPDPPAAVPPGWDDARAQGLVMPLEQDHDAFFVARRRRLR